MGELTAYGSQITSVFQLIGTLENDITKSIAWAFCQCSSFSKHVFDELFSIHCNPDNIMITYQQWEAKKGITDLEITDNDLFYVIIEAKRGWVLPGPEQLTLYSERKSFTDSQAKNKAIITMSECSDVFADTYLPFKSVNNIPIRHLSWKRLYEIATIASGESSFAERRILKELTNYLGRIMTMQEKTSNWVYVVSLSYAKAEGSELSYVDIVEKKGKYYHPFGVKGWPKEAPNYIAFRYDGRLQSIHHIENYVVTKRIHEIIPELPDVEWETSHFVYSLGPAIKPSKIVKTGNIYASGRKWAMLDLLLTSDTIAEACDLSAQRVNS